MIADDKGEILWSEFIEHLRRIPWSPDDEWLSTAQLQFLRSYATRISQIPVARILSETNTAVGGIGRTWAILELEASGAITIAHDDIYGEALAGALRTDKWQAHYAGALPDFFPIVWRMIENGAYVLQFWQWDDSLRRWSREGALPRDRLLRTLLDALNRSPQTNVAKWMVTFYGSLEPTIKERARDQDLARSLLRSTNRGTVQFAATFTEILHQHGRLDAEALMGATPPLAGLTAIAARQLLDIVVAECSADAALVDIARPVVASALGHSQRAIQSRAKSWLESNGGEELVNQAIAVLSPAVAADRRKPDQPADDRAADPSPRQWRTFEPWPVNEIAERTAILLEDATDPLEVEAGLQAWAALDDPSQLASLTKRAMNPTSHYNLSALVAQVVAAVSGISLHLQYEDPYPGLEFPPLMQSRFEEVRLRLLDGGWPRSLLAAPISSAGWVSTSDLVHRMQANDAAGLPVWRSDLTVALLRLDPDDPERESALELALPQAARSEAWAVIAYALGGPESRVQTASWWVAAARAKSDEPNDHLARSGLDLPGQSRPTGSGFSADELRIIRMSTGNKDFAWFYDQPTVIVDPWQTTRFPNRRSDAFRWAGLTWPRSVEFAASLTAGNFSNSSDYGYEQDGLAATLDAIAESPGRIGPLGMACVIYGLSAKHRLIRAQAAELLSAELGGRLQHSDFVGEMIRRVEGCKLSRWAESLADAASISAESQTKMIRLCTVLLPRLDPTRVGVGAMIEMFDDAVRRSGVVLTDPALLYWLGEFTGSSNAAKAARGLLALARTSRE